MSVILVILRVPVAVGWIIDMAAIPPDRRTLGGELKSSLCSIEQFSVSYKHTKSLKITKITSFVRVST
jgi:hypothetical protein